MICNVCYRAHKENDPCPMRIAKAILHWCVLYPELTVEDTWSIRDPKLTTADKAWLSTIPDYSIEKLIATLMGW